MSKLFIGLMSGTSVDSVDTVLIDLEENNIQLIGSCSYPISGEIKQAVFSAVKSNSLSIEEISQLDETMARVFIGAVQKILSKEKKDSKDIIAIGSHGQTIKHSPNPPNPFSLQVGEAKIIANTTKITTVTDFRSQDITAGGQGAPLTPIFHEKIFNTDQKKKVIVNIGGITNLTSIDPSNFVFGYDTGPGNCLMDIWSREHIRKDYDEEGNWASSGTSEEELLKIMLNDDYFKKNYPKSTGPDYFNLNWIYQAISKCERKFQPQDVQATLLQLTVKTLTEGLLELELNNDEIIFYCGGGLHNKYLMDQIEKELEREIFSTYELGVNPDYLEAISFAWFAKQRIDGRSFELSKITGSKGKVFLGTITEPSK